MISKYIRSGITGTLAVVLFLLHACGQEQETPVQLTVAQLEEAFVQSNKYLIELENEAIDDFVTRYGWKAHKTGSGLRYKIITEGAGPNATYGDRAVLNYSVYLITGDKVYDSDTDGPLVFTVGRGGVVSGLEEGILMMRKGTKATFIMPFHLAYGVPGDGNKIPKRASIIYQVELIDLI